MLASPHTFCFVQNRLVIVIITCHSLVEIMGNIKEYFLLRMFIIIAGKYFPFLTTNILILRKMLIFP